MANQTSQENFQELEASVATTRARIAQEVNELSNRLDPDHLKAEVREFTIQKKEEAVEKIKDKARGIADSARGAGQAVVTVARDNSIPLVLIGGGVGWLLYDRYQARIRESRTHYPQRLGDDSTYLSQSHFAAGAQGGDAGFERTKEADPTHAVRQRAADAKERVMDAGSRAQTQIVDAAHAASDRARSYGRRGKNAFDNTLETNPLALGAAAVIAGAAVGMLLPRTQREDQWMGESRDRLLREGQKRARSAAETAIDRAQEAAGKAQEKVSHQLEAKPKSTNNTGDTSKSPAQGPPQRL